MYKKGMDGNVLLYLLSCIKTFEVNFQVLRKSQSRYELILCFKTSIMHQNIVKTFIFCYLAACKDIESISNNDNMYDREKKCLTNLSSFFGS